MLPEVKMPEFGEAAAIFPPAVLGEGGFIDKAPAETNIVSIVRPHPHLAGGSLCRPEVFSHGGKAAFASDNLNPHHAWTF